VTSPSPGAADTASAPSAALDWTAGASRAVDLIRVLAMDAVQQAGAALIGLPVTYVRTHDSIGLGEDGPTHQPVEHLAAQRGIPGLGVVRGCGANETVKAWRTILEQPSRPAGLCLSRPNLPVLDRGETSQNGLASADAAARGGYILAEGTDSDPAVILIATGSEVRIALAARDSLQGEGISTRVVSMPCVEWFTAQDASYQEEVLPSRIRARVCVEQASRSPGLRSPETSASASAWSISGHRPHRRSCTRSTGSPRSTWPQPPGPAWAGWTRT
jgi:transketolase C-terminal domain/subunit